MVFWMIDERLSVDGERGEDGRGVLPGEVTTGVLDDEVGVARESVGSHELTRSDLMFDERLFILDLRR